jgi:hypothetical protein
MMRALLPVARGRHGQLGRRRGGAASAWAGLFLAVAALAAGGCSPHRELYIDLEKLAAAGKYEQAAQVVQKAKSEYGERNEVLWNMDLAVFYTYAGQYDLSNQALERAERRIDALFTESISGNVAAFISNDNTLPYKGEDFESVVVNIYRALNYAGLGKLESALVEARKVDQKLNHINSQYAPSEKNAYKEDAFARLLMGAFYEAGGSRSDLNDAFISNRLATGIYDKEFQPIFQAAAPDVLRSNLITTAEFMGREELEQSKAKYANTPFISLDDKKKQGQVYFVHFAGRAPVKVEENVAQIMPDGNVFKIAFPKYSRAPSVINGSRVLVDGQVSTQLQVGHPTASIAIRSLEDRMGRIRAKAIARAVTKYMAGKALRDSQNRESAGRQLLAFAAAAAYNIASEQADLRAWQTLPSDILIGRVLLPPGKHKLAVQYLTAGGAVVATKDFGELEVPAGGTKFIVFHTNN